jgi:predicted nucleotidyltransferase
VSAFPDFNPNGDLPPGVHRASLAAVLEHFGGATEQRRIVAQRLERIHRLAIGTGALARFIVFGSFVTDKAAPNDVDIFLVMEDRFDVATVVGETRYVFDHMAAHNLLGASVFWIPRAACLGGEDAAVLDWQIKRDGARRGIVEVTP